MYIHARKQGNFQLVFLKYEAPCNWDMQCGVVDKSDGLGSSSPGFKSLLGHGNSQRGRDQ